MKNRNTMDSRRMKALGCQFNRDFNRLAKKVSIGTSAGRRFKVKVAGGGIGAYRLAVRASRWFRKLGLEVSYLGRITGRRGAHVLEVRS